MPRSGCAGAGAGDGDRSRGGSPAAEELSLSEVPLDAKPGSRGAFEYVRRRRGSLGSAGFASGRTRGVDGSRGDAANSASRAAKMPLRVGGSGIGTSGATNPGGTGFSSIHCVDFRGTSVGRDITGGGAFGACFWTGGAECGEGVPWPRLGVRGEFDLTERNSTLEHREHRNARPNGSSRT